MADLQKKREKKHLPQITLIGDGERVNLPPKLTTVTFIPNLSNAS